MGLTKQYLRYTAAGNFNIIASNSCNVQFVSLGGQEGRYAAVGAQEHIIIWDFRLGDKAQVLVGEKSVVTRLCASTNQRHLAAGYSDGSVQIYDLKSTEILNVYSGHRSEITSLSYDGFGHKLASGSLDTDVIVWDTVTESGMCRLSGHKGPVTQTLFMAEQNMLISSSKDSYVKFWDLDTQHCFRTLIGHHSEIWSIVLMKEDRYLVTACGDMELRVWKLAWKRSEEDDSKLPAGQLSQTLELNGSTEDDPNHPLQCCKVGSLLRTGMGRVCCMVADGTGQVLACHGTDKQLELFYFCTEEEAAVRMKKRLKKENKRRQEGEDAPPDVTVELSLRDNVKRLPAIKLPDRPRSLDLVTGGRGEEMRLVVALAANSLQMYGVTRQQGSGSVSAEQQKLLRWISGQGHRSEVRAVAFSHDGLAIVSASSESVKLWNRPSQACLRTVETEGAALCVCFVPGDRHVLTGMDDGRLLIVDVAAGDVLETVPAHASQLWSVCVTADLGGCVTASSDCTLKFWQFELVQEQQAAESADAVPTTTNTKVLSLLHTRTLALEHGVLCARLTPNSKFVAAALLDSTVKIFFVDTFKFYLSLYGHKMPVLCMDVSSDSSLLVTGSSDHNVRIWGLDFGDCRKSLFAHDGPVTGVQFVGRTHHLFSCGKDGTVKLWDGDAHVKIMSLQGHASEARGLAVSPNGKHMVSCGTDRVLRLAQLSDQVLVLEDEEEREREQKEERALLTADGAGGAAAAQLPTRRTVGSERAADDLLECLEVCKEFAQQAKEGGVSQLPALMSAYRVTTPEALLLLIVQRIRSSDLEEALLLLPFGSACELLQMLPGLLKHSDTAELVCRLLVFLLRVHHASILNVTSLLPVLQKLQKLATFKMGHVRDVVGFNLHGMRFVQRQVEAAESVQLFRDATLNRVHRDKKRKQREKHKRSIIMIS